jgi:UDP-glucose 4-epimerase
VDRAHSLLGWHHELSLQDAIASALAWGEKRQEILGYE